MSLLGLHGLPVDYNGIPLDTDYRTMVAVELALYDEELSEIERIMAALNLLYPGYSEPDIPCPANLEEALQGLAWFHSCGKSDKNGNKKEAANSPKKYYSFEQDAAYIYTSFSAAYGIRLVEIEYMHWWEFIALFSNLPEKTLMAQILYCRAADTSKLPKEEKKRVSKMREVYGLRKQGLQELSLAQLNKSTQDYYDKRVQG